MAPLLSLANESYGWEEWAAPKGKDGQIDWPAGQTSNSEGKRRHSGEWRSRGVKFRARHADLLLIGYFAALQGNARANAKEAM